MIFQLVWVTENERLFEESVPLLWHGEYLAKRGWGNGIRLGFLEGMELISVDYRRRLEQLGYELIDCSALIRDCLEELPELATYRKTIRYWFLRWNVLERLTRHLADMETVVHIDADVVLQIDPAELYGDVRGKTFVLQGCPVITVISDREWFSVWRTELASYLASPDAYVQEALRIKENPVRDSREYCNGLYYIPGRFHDQDMLEYLIASGKLPQDKSEKVFNSAYYWIASPLFPVEWALEQIGESIAELSASVDGCYVGNKKIAFYHMHTDFVKYCYFWWIANKLGLKGNVIRYLFDRIAATGSSFQDLFWKILLVLRRSRYISRRFVYGKMFDLGPVRGNLSVFDIINSLSR